MKTTTRTTRQEATAARKDQIIQAAVTVLAERGYQATTFEAICEQADLSSKRLITYHFSNKDELFAAIANTLTADAAAFMQPALDAATGARELLAAHIRSNTAFIAGHLKQIRALQQIVFNGGHVWDRPYAESLYRLASLFADGQRTGAFRPCNPQIMAATLRAALDAMYAPLSTGLHPDECANELIELFDRATLPT
jgi:AcrR family transcriptional regulator